LVAWNKAGDFITALAFDSECNRVIVGHASGAVNVWSTHVHDDFEAIQLLPPSGACVKMITVSPEGQIVCILGYDEVYVWDCLRQPPVRQRFLAVLKKKVYKPKYITSWFHIDQNIYIYDQLKHVMCVHSLTQERAFAFSTTIMEKCKLVCVSTEILPDFRCSLFLFLITARDKPPRLDLFGDVDLENNVFSTNIDALALPASSLWGFTGLDHCVYFIKGNEEIHFLEIDGEEVTHKFFKTHGGAISAFDVTENELILLRSNRKISIIQNWKSDQRTKRSYPICGKIMREYPHILKKEGNRIVWSCDSGVFYYEIEEDRSEPEPRSEVELMPQILPNNV